MSFPRLTGNVSLLLHGRTAYEIMHGMSEQNAGEYEHPRAHERFELIAQVEVRGGDDVVVVVPIVNVSAGGAFLSATKDELADFPEGSEVSIFLSYELGGEDVDINGVGEVVRHQNDGEATGVGIRWTSDDANFLDSLATLIAVLRS